MNRFNDDSKVVACVCVCVCVLLLHTHTEPNKFRFIDEWPASARATDTLLRARHANNSAGFKHFFFIQIWILPWTVATFWRPFCFWQNQQTCRLVDIELAKKIKKIFNKKKIVLVRGTRKRPAAFRPMKSSSKFSASARSIFCLSLYLSLSASASSHSVAGLSWMIWPTCAPSKVMLTLNEMAI